MSCFTRIARRYFSERSDDFVFRRYRPDISFSLKPGSGLYLHIPFCSHFCPYCPYNKIRYDIETARKYKEAVIREIDFYHQLYGKAAFSSLYVGGGTPTLLMKEIEEIMEHLARHFSLEGDSCIETNPGDIDSSQASRIRSAGFSMISIGIQSFQDKLLNKIGRDYTGKQAVKATECLMNAGFKTVNSDFIFAIGGQTIGEVESDLKAAVDLGVDQVTCYPLFTFPYSEIGEMRRIRKVSIPSGVLRKKMYYHIHDYLLQQNYRRTSVWSFNRQDKECYSSVTRDNYIGLGAGAGSYNGRIYCFNTFSVPEYIHKLETDLPLSLMMNVSSKMERSFWLYWRLYETELQKNAYTELFDRDIESDYSSLFSLFRLTGMIGEENGEFMRLSRKGAYHVHRIQNLFALDYVNSIWKTSKVTPWPEEVRL